MPELDERIGTWSRKGGSITVTIKKARRVGGKRYDYKAKYLGDKDDPVSPAHVQRDIQMQFPELYPVMVANKTGRGGPIIKG